MTTTIRAILFGRFNSYGIHRFNFFLTAVFLNTPIPITLPCFLIPSPPLSSFRLYLLRFWNIFRP